MSGMDWHLRGDKPSKLHKLSWRERRQGRELAVAAYRKAKGDAATAEKLTLALGGDNEAAEQLLRGHAGSAGIDPATIILLIKIALALWDWWNQRSVDDPGDRPMEGEPVFTEVSGQ